MTHRNTPHARPQSARRSGFTLVELLIVIGIIAILVGILLPVAAKIRTTARRTQTLATISKISQGCEAYFSAFGAYPGTFSNSAVLNNTTTPNPIGGTPATSITFLNYPGSNPSASPYITSTENMVLSLCGGLTTTTTAGTYQFDLNNVGLGAASLNSLKPGRSQAFVEVQASELSTTMANPRATVTTLSPGQWTPNDTPLPEILDSFAQP
ncbi:MAG: type II secretion system protein, partial [Tepidisphaeraceae bacterium]